MKKILFVIFAIFITTSCKKFFNSKNPVIIEGTLMLNCDTPAANKSGFILTDDGLFSGPGISLSFTTDENGYFKITHTGRENVGKFMVRVDGFSDVLRVGYLSGKKKNLGKIYINYFPTNFIIKLDVKKSYTENDTLVMYNFKNATSLANSTVYFPGPFTSGVLDSISNYKFTKFPLHFSNGVYLPPFIYVRYIIRSTPSMIHIDKTTDFDISPICSDKYAEVTLVID